MRMTTEITAATGADFYLIDDLLTPAERAVRDTVRAFCDREVIPIINDYWERAEFPRHLVRRLGELGLVGDGIAGYGCPPMSPIATGLVHLELNRGDGSLGTFVGVQAGLAMQSIAMLGSEEQKQRWLPRMAAVEALGAFALTEPDHGSDSVALETTARREGERDVGAQAHENGREAGREAGGGGHGGDRHAGLAQDRGVYRDDIGHREEGGDAGQGFGTHIRAPLGQLEPPLKKRGQC